MNEYNHNTMADAGSLTKALLCPMDKGKRSNSGPRTDSRSSASPQAFPYSRPVTLDVQCLGQWQTPFWVGNEDKGPVTRAGFVAETRINRHDFGVSWNAPLDGGGVVVGHEVFLTLDVEALQDTV